MANVKDYGYVDQYGGNFPMGYGAPGYAYAQGRYGFFPPYGSGVPEEYSPGPISGNMSQYPRYTDQYSGNWPNTEPSTLSTVSDVARATSDVANAASGVTKVLNKAKAPFDYIEAVGKTGLGLGLLGDATGIVTSIGNLVMRYKEAKEAQRRFDKQFDEDVRRYGIEQAMKEYAQRKGMSLEDARAMLQAGQFGLTKQVSGENIKASALGRNIESTKFKWAKEDRAKQQAYAKALQKGLLMGLGGGK